MFVYHQQSATNYEEINALAIHQAKTHILQTKYGDPYVHGITGVTPWKATPPSRRVLRPHYLQETSQLNMFLARSPTTKQRIVSVYDYLLSVVTYY